MKLIKILEEVMSEIGDASAKPYPYEKTGGQKDHRRYRFVTDSNDSKEETIYQVDLEEIKPEGKLNRVLYKLKGEYKDQIKLEVSFSVIDLGTMSQQYYVTNKGELYRVMSTVIAIVKEDLENHPYIKKITFKSSSRENKDTGPNKNARTSLYLKYIKNHFPNAKVNTEPDGSVVIDIA